MQPPEKLSRRVFLKSGLSTLAVGPAVLLSACSDDGAMDRGLQFATLDEAMAEAERLAANAAADPGPGWTLPQTFVHCAQSIEYSMTGFPEMKSTVFQNTVGSAAFNVFAWRGRMSHDLTEAIPGAPSLADEADLEAALARLHTSVEAFHAAPGPLQPHFAYGTLSKSDYELAHAMHLANHFTMMPG